MTTHSGWLSEPQHGLTKENSPENDSKKNIYIFCFVFYILITNLIRIMNGLNKHILLVTIQYDTELYFYKNFQA